MTPRRERRYPEINVQRLATNVLDSSTDAIGSVPKWRCADCHLHDPEPRLWHLEHHHHAKLGSDLWNCQHHVCNTDHASRFYRCRRWHQHFDLYYHLYRYSRSSV